MVVLTNTKLREGNLASLLAALQGQAISSSNDDSASTESKRTFFVNSTWVTPAKTTFKFLPKGKGIQVKNGLESVFEWRLSGGMVTADFGKNRYIYFTFSPAESFFGVLKGQVNQPLTKE